MSKTIAVIPAEVIEAWKSDPSNTFDQACASVGSYMRQHGCTRAEAIEKLNLSHILK